MEDLSIYEDLKDRSFLKKTGKSAAKNAVNENRVMGIPITFLEDGWIVRRMPNGEIVKLKPVAERT